MGRYKEARELLEQSIEIVNKNKSSLESHPVTASIFKCIGDVYKELGDYKKAQELLESSMSIYEKQHGRNHIDTAGVLNSLGQVYMRSGQYEKAEMTINEALTILNLKKHPKSYKCLESLFELYLMKSKESKTESKELKQEAIKHLKEAHSITKNYFSENSPHVIRIQNKLEQLDVA